MTSNRLLRFCLVGVVNTTVDTTIFVLLRLAGLSIFAANLVSSSCGVTVSLILNTAFTFRAGRLSRNRIIAYIAVTVVGLWVVQPLVITWLSWVDGRVGLAAALGQLIGHQRVLASLVPKLGSVDVTLVWNYVWYSRVVYAQKPIAEV
jgi:putative flippase GtrA